MIILNKGETNDIYVTVADVATSSSDDFTLNAVNTVSKVSTEITMSRINNDTIRYDQFQIDESEYNMSKGKYDYTITDSSGSVVELGKLEVVGTEVTSSVYNRTDNTVVFYERT